jgi:hypothetical protein
MFCAAGSPPFFFVSGVPKPEDGRVRPKYAAEEYTQDKYRVRQHNFLFSKLNKTHCMNQNIFICFL